MKIYHVIFVITLIKSSRQLCRSTVGVTTCENEILSRNKPLKITDYKHLLEFRSVNLGEIPSQSFKFLPELNVLHISNNHVNYIQAGAFDGLQDLRKLVLYNNDLTIINEGTFRNLDNLNTLDLGQNKIATVKINAFADLSSLQDLNLGFNYLETVPAAVNKIKSLTHLRLDNNRLNSLTANAFNNLNKLELLDLSDNRIDAIPSHAFAGLAKLKELNLKSNYLSNLNVGDLVSDLRALAVVKLAVNSFDCRYLSAVIDGFRNRSVEVARGVSKSQDTVHGIGCKKV